ncbi:hypothetical protein QWZ13_19135 [Reinekea marina]|nr:hypothetical protein [Reinekea marina]MDN3651029.1 hypothetical protein [Reinekea marina]
MLNAYTPIEVKLVRHLLSGASVFKGRSKNLYHGGFMVLICWRIILN